MRTTIIPVSPLEHEILHWAINADFFGEADRDFPAGWASWDRTGVLNSKRFVLDWETPHITTYTKFMLQRLQGLSEGAKDRYAKVAMSLEKRIRRNLESHNTSKPS